MSDVRLRDIRHLGRASLFDGFAAVTTLAFGGHLLGEAMSSAQPAGPVLLAAMLLLGGLGFLYKLDRALQKVNV